MCGGDLKPGVVLYDGSKVFIEHEAEVQIVTTDIQQLSHPLEVARMDGCFDFNTDQCAVLILYDDVDLILIPLADPVSRKRPALRSLSTDRLMALRSSGALYTSSMVTKSNPRTKPAGSLRA